jgi:hypothetical protein
MLSVSGLNLVCGWQRQVRSSVESIGWVWHGVYKFLRFRIALFGKVTDGFSFILNKFRDLLAVVSVFPLYKIMECSLTLLQLLTLTPLYAVFIHIAR